MRKLTSREVMVLRLRNRKGYLRGDHMSEPGELAIARRLESKGMLRRVGSLEHTYEITEAGREASGLVPGEAERLEMRTRQTHHARSR